MANHSSIKSPSKKFGVALDEPQNIEVKTPPKNSLFGVHGILSPGVKLMRNLSFASKAMIISLSFLIPVVLLTYFFAVSQYDQINFSQKEHVGVEVFKKFLPIYTGVLKTRNATRATLGKFDGKSRYVSARDETDQAIKTFADYLKNSGDVLLIKPEFEKLTAAWTSTSQSNSGADDKGRTVFGPVTASIVSILSLIGDNSNLVLDPDLDSFYLMNAMVLVMPNLTENLGQLWGWGTYAMAHPGLSIPEEKNYGLWSARVDSGLKDFKDFAHRSTKFNPSLEKQLDLTIIDDTHTFYQYAKDPDALINATDMTPLAYFNKGEAAVLRLQSFYEKGLPALDELLVSRIDKATNNLIWISIAVFISLFFAVYFFYSFFLVTRGGLRLISQHLKEVAQGDLRQTPNKPWGLDEPAKVINDLRQAYDALHVLISKVSQAAQELDHSSDEIASASLELSSRTESAAASLEEQAATMGKIGSLVAATADRSKMAADFASENAEVAKQGGKVFEDVVKTMNDIHASSAKINDIISVIDGIAFQTNILALNAAVEAARAGEQGRGFAVVATEVRLLAGRSADAAKEIKKLISTSVDQVDGGLKRIKNASETMNKVVTNAFKVNEYMTEISTSSREQAFGVEQVGQAIHELDRNTQQNAALVEQTSASADELRNQARALQNEIANFKIAHFA